MQSRRRLRRWKRCRWSRRSQRQRSRDEKSFHIFRARGRRARVGAWFSTLVCLEHPADAKFVVERSVRSKEHLLQRIGDIGAFREFCEKALQVLECAATQIKTNRIAANRDAVGHQPV